MAAHRGYTTVALTPDHDHGLRTVTGHHTGLGALQQRRQDGGPDTTAHRIATSVRLPGSPPSSSGISWSSSPRASAPSPYARAEAALI